MKCSRAGIDAPTIFFVDPVKNTLYMEHIEGITAKQFFMADHTDEGGSFFFCSSLLFNLRENCCCGLFVSRYYAKHLEFDLKWFLFRIL